MTAHCDLATGKIYGCKKGSFIWWHEKGHIEFNKLELSGNLRLFQQWMFWGWMLSVTLTIVNKYMLFVSVPTFFLYIACEIYEEVWCNNYAKEKYLNT